MAGIKFARRVLGAAIATIGVAMWIADLMLTFTLPYSEYENDTLVALVPISGAVLVLGGLLLGMWG
ncbi:SepZ protein [Acidianus sulfidivorans JP7]|uniref:SepZ protein n=1 Tax=Acidianus sulfidivorans JP7 TaxID=619593 RepID=A0A2U9ILN7_9CREN|nr:SepZ protein [Acidianus sulfidivorans]AWR96931.1 SepZ protein [Acidianus sulfidivorans JP7]